MPVLATALVALALLTTTLRGQVVCSVCWFEAERPAVAYGSKADLECAAACAAKDIPPALAVADAKGAFTLYRIDDPEPPAGSGPGWLPLIGKQVVVEATIGEAIRPPRIRVRALTVVGATAPPTPAGLIPADQSEAAPELRFLTLEGTWAELSALRGKPVLLNFWATWCGPCRAEMPLLARLGREYRERGAVLVAASADGEPERVRSYLAQNKLELPQVWLRANAGDMEKVGLGPALPATVLLDSAGRIRWRHSGIVDEQQVRSRLDPLLAAAP